MAEEEMSDEETEQTEEESENEEVSSELEQEVEVEEEAPEPEIETEGKFYGTGRRKQSVARVWVTAGTGKFSVDGNDLDFYFDHRTRWTKEAKKPLACLDFEDKIDVEANLEGGGKTGQAEALKMGLARALVDMDPNARPPLHSDGLLTRDDRQAERKKINQPGARKKSQVSKR